MTRPYTHAAEKYINEYVDLRIAGDKSTKARRLRNLLIKHLQYTPAELDIFVEERYIELDSMLEAKIRAYQINSEPLNNLKMAAEELLETS